MKSRALLPPVLLLAVTVLLPAVGAAQHFPPRAVLDSLVQERVRARAAAGIVLGVMEADGTTTVVTAGTAGPDARPISERTVFEIGSITKTFTGTVLAEMAMRAELSIDDPVSAHLPDSVAVPSRNGRVITLRDLSTHHSALPRLPSNLQPADRQNPYADYTVRHLYDFLAEHELRRDIGSEFEYSNLAVGLLGHALSLTAEVPYEGLVLERILEPLGMDMTGIELEGEMLDWMAQGHNQRRRVVPLWDLPTLAGAGALRSNMEDMLRYLAANMGAPETPLEEAMRDAHETRETVSEQVSIGLNWITQRVGTSRIIWHNGGTAGFRTFMGFDPDREVGAVVLINSSHSADDLGLHLVDNEIPLLPGGRGPEAAAIVGVGWLVFVLGLVGVLLPKTLVSLVERSGRSKKALYVTSGLRAAIGAILVYGATSTGFPPLFTAIGVVGLLGAVGLPVMGLARYNRMMAWWTELPSRLRRAHALVSLAFGAFMIYGAM